MELYYAKYRNHFYSEFSNKWQYTSVKSIIVIADNISEAMTKVEKCLSKLSGEDNNAILIDMVKCVGLNAYEGFEDTFRLESIADETEVITE